MPYILPARSEPGAEEVKEAAPPADDRYRALHRVPGPDPAEEELQVRQTAQRILAAHLHLPQEIFSAAPQRRRPSPRRAFWPGISLDLTGATLVDFHFAQVSVLQAKFAGAIFRGDAWFRGATFWGDARFGGATFQGVAVFSKAIFRGDARFGGAVLQRNAWFAGTQVLHLDDPDLNRRRAWPDGGTVRPDPADPTRGTLVYAEQAEEPEPADPSPDPTGR